MRGEERWASSSPRRHPLRACCFGWARRGFQVEPPTPRPPQSAMLHFFPLRSGGDKLLCAAMKFCMHIPQSVAAFHPTSLYNIPSQKMKDRSDTTLSYKRFHHSSALKGLRFLSASSLQCFSVMCGLMVCFQSAVAGKRKRGKRGSVEPEQSLESLVEMEGWSQPGPGL